jgi:prepilin-type N-terminal cleavage/methylation domain-containing protein
MSWPASKGFTLMELVATLIVLGLMTSFAVPYLSNGVRAYNDTATALQTVSKLRYASERMARELREIRNVGGAFDITTPVNAPGNNITFFKWDGVQLTRVRISDTAPTLSLAYDTLASDADFTLTDELTSVTFNYFQADGTQATGINNVVYIEFELILNNGNSYSQRSRVALRNRQ